MTDEEARYVDSLWRAIALRMRSCAPTGGRMAILTMRVLTVDGKPVSWAKPSVTMIEGGADKGDLLHHLGGDAIDTRLSP